MINLEGLNKIIEEMKGSKPVKSIKVTTEFAQFIMREISILPFSMAKQLFDKGPICYQGIQIVIDDEIEGYYELVY